MFIASLLVTARRSHSPGGQHSEWPLQVHGGLGGWMQCDLQAAQPYWYRSQPRAGMDRSYCTLSSLSPGSVTRDYPAQRPAVTDGLRGQKPLLGRSFNDLCPVAALVAYLATRGNLGGPFFQYHDGTTLSRERLVAQVRQALLAAGKDTAPYSSHSFRIGAATTAASRGVEDSLIKILGRWESAAYQRYVKISRERLAGVSRILATE